MTADARSWVKFGFALIGAACALGSVAGACYGLIRLGAAMLYEDEEPY